MTNHQPRNTTTNSRLIRATADVLYCAFTDPEALVVWQVPGEMTGEVHQFDYRTGGGYTMSLHYPPSAEASPGKTADHEDRYTTRFVELDPPKAIIQAITFDTTDPAFMGELTMAITLEKAAGGTLVTIAFADLPPGIRPEDNEAGTESSLEKLARYVEK